MAPPVRWVELGRIGAPFGLAGWLHVSSFTEPAAGLLEYQEWTLRLGSGERRQYRILEGRPQGERLVVRLEDVEGRDAAALLTGAWVEVARAELPPTGDREYYRADLIGFEVTNLEGIALGRVAYFIDAPAGAVMVVAEREGAAAGTHQASHTEHWVLADPAHLRQVDLAAGQILVDWPAELE
jgi:16S rRNA processing protein RimM